MIEEDIDLGRFFEKASSGKLYVTRLNLHEIKSEILLVYTGDFELNGSMVIGPVERKTNIRFKNMDDFESYVNAIVVDYDSRDVTFTGYIYKLNTPQFKVFKQSAHAKSVSYMKKIGGYYGQNCFIPFSGIRFIKSIKYFTRNDYWEQFQDFIRNEKCWSGLMTSARI